MKKKILLWLDDVRDPQKCGILEKYGIDPNSVDIRWAKSYDDFVWYINEDDYADIVCFDHDLGKDVEIKEREENGLSKRQARKRKKNIKNGLDCAKYFINFLHVSKAPIPKIIVHSMNPVGKKRIEDEINDFIKLQ